MRRAGLRYAFSLGALLVTLGSVFGSHSVLELPDPVTPQAATEITAEPRKSETGQAAVQPAKDSTGANLIFASPDRGGKPEPASHWIGTLMLLWIAGTCAMAFRSAWGISLDRLALKRCIPVEDPSWVSAFESMKQTLGIGGSVRLLMGPHISMPSACGWLTRAVLVPAAMVTGTDPQLLRAVLAHELAHLQRHDYLVNFLQMAVEALLFFNPAIWWISRQTRLEREACCDRIGGRLIEDKAAYVRALARFAETLGGRGALSPQLGLPGPPGSLLERVRRMLIPGYRPGMRLPLTNLGAGLILSLGFLGSVLFLTERATAQIHRFFTEREASQIIAQMRGVIPSKGMTRFECKVFDEHGDPFNGFFKGQKINYTESMTFHNPVGGRAVDGLFSIELENGLYDIGFFTDGYVPVWFPKILLEEPVFRTETQLSRGFPVSVSVRDEEGRPLPSFVGLSYLEKEPSLRVESRTDGNGVANFPISKPFFGELSVSLYDYQNYTSTRWLEPGSHHEIVLEKKSIWGRSLPSRWWMRSPGNPWRYFLLNFFGCKEITIIHFHVLVQQCLGLPTLGKAIR